jgi:hypothetical protein
MTEGWPSVTLMTTFAAMTNIDRADWHYGGNYPAGLPPENGGTHIGIYLAWIIQRGLGSRKLKTFAAGMLQQVLDRKATGRDLLFSELDEKFFPELLTPEAQRFTKSYYESNEYVNDYARVLGGSLETLYHVHDTWDNYDRMAPVLDERFAEWKARKV